MTEFIVGFIAVIVLFVGLLQIASLARVETETMVNARRQAAEYALSDPASLSTPAFIKDVLIGDDGSSYSVDDTFTTTDPADFLAYIVEPSAPSATEWTIIDGVPSNQFTAIRSSSVPSYEFEMVRGMARDSVPLIPAVQKLIYAADSIEIKSEVWMPWLRDIY